MTSPAWPLGCMYIGWAQLYQSVGILTYVAAFLLTTHVFVIAYEEPTLRRTFGQDYEMYCQSVGRWWP